MRSLITIIPLRSFQKEKVEWFQLKNSFLETEGSCPGCNQETGGGGFLSGFNPRNWLNGIDSFSEGLAMFLEIGLYLLTLVLVVGVWRRCLWPFLKWAFRSTPNNYKLSQHKIPLSEV